jgi:multiple sugar transport system permease protein
MAEQTARRLEVRQQARPAAGASWSRRLEMIGLYTLLGIFAVIFFVPFYWVLSASVKEISELRRIPPTWIPQSFTLEHYTDVVSAQFGRYFLNTFIYAGATTLIVLFTSTLLGFVLVKHPSRFGNLVFGLVVATMMVPFATYVVPLHGLLLDIEETFGIPMINTYWGMILPWVLYPFGIFLMRQAMFGVPDELIDAARIDGASTWGIYWRIVVPLISANLAALAIFVFIFKYDDLLWPLVVATDSSMYPVTVGLAEFIGTYWVEYGLFTAASALVILPILLLYIFLQRYIIQGVALTGLKG